MPGDQSRARTGTLGRVNSRSRGLRLLQLVLVGAVAVLLGVLFPDAVAVPLVGGLITAAVVGRVWAQTSERATPAWVGASLVAAPLVMIGRMLVWWGPAGTAVAMGIMIVVLLVVIVTIGF